MKTYLLLTFIFLFSIKSYGAKVLGADIYFETKGDGKVDVYVKRFTLLSNKDTAPIKINLLLGNSVFTQQSVLHSSTLFSIYNKNYTFTYADSFSARVSKEEIFKTTFNFNLQILDSLLKNQCMALFYYTDSSRNMGQTVFDSTKRFYIDASLNMCLYKTLKTKPEFTNAPLFSLCCNFPSTISPGYKNRNNINDSFSFEVVAVKDSIGKSVSYNSPNSSNIPLDPFCPPTNGTVNCRALPGAKPPRGFYFNIESYYIGFTPVNCNQSSAIVFQTNIYTMDSLYRWVKVGYITREQSVKTENCADNNPPEFYGNNNYSVCAGSKICLRLKASDYPFMPFQTKADTITLSWDKTIDNATFRYIDSNAREKEAEFCWQTHDSDGRYAPYLFTVEAKDNNYPIEARGVVSVKIMVLPRPYNNKSYSFLDCNRLAFSFKKERYRKIRWDIYDTLNNYYASSQKFADTLQLYGLKSDAMIIKSEFIPYNCPSYDTIFNTKQITDNQTNKDTFVCSTINSFNIEVLNQDSIQNPTWIINNAIVQNKTIDFSTINTFPAIFQIKMRYQKNNNCASERNLRLVVEKPKVKVLKPLSICLQSNVNLFQQGFHKRKNAIWSSNIASSIDTLGNLNKNIYKDSLQMTYYYDSSVCTHSETKIMFIDNRPRTSAFRDTNFCNTTDSINLQTINTQNIQNTSWYLNDSALNPPIINFKPLNTFPIALPLTMKYVNDSGCLAQKKITITIYAPHTKTISPIYNCKNNDIALFNKGITKRKNGFWQQFNTIDIDSNGLMKGIINTNNLSVSYYFDSAFCTHSENISITIDTGVVADFYANTVIKTKPYIANFIDKSKGKITHYYWNFGNLKTQQDTSSYQNPSYLYEALGKYTISLIVKGQICTDTMIKRDYISVETNTSIISPLNENTFTLFPNPADKTISINTLLQTDLQIINILGVIIIKTTLSPGETNIDISNLPSGIYFVTSNMGIKKLVVAH